ncbi:MAG: PnuC protein [Candidatus Eisenbacteria bacterium]
MISRYYFLDWIAMALSLAAMVMLGNRDRRGFALFAFSNALWVVVGVWAHSLAIALGNAAFLLINLRGWWRWQADAATLEDPGT